MEACTRSLSAGAPRFFGSNSISFDSNKTTHPKRGFESVPQKQGVPFWREEIAPPLKAAVFIFHDFPHGAAVAGEPRSFRQLPCRRPRLLRERRYPPAAACQLSAAVVGRQKAFNVHLATVFPISLDIPALQSAPPLWGARKRTLCTCQEQVHVVTIFPHQQVVMHQHGSLL